MRRGVPRRRAVDAEMSADDSQKPAHKPVGNLIIGSFSIGPCAHLGVCPLLAQMRSADRIQKCLLFGVDRTYRGNRESDASDPEQTWPKSYLGADGRPVSLAPSLYYPWASSGRMR